MPSEPITDAYTVEILRLLKEQDLESLFQLEMKQASEKLGIEQDDLREALRSLFGQEEGSDFIWPYRSIKSYTRNINKLLNGISELDEISDLKANYYHSMIAAIFRIYQERLDAVLES